MPFPILEVAGLGANLVSSILGASEAKRRQRALEQAANRMFQENNRRYNEANFSLRRGRDEYLADPARAALRSEWQKRLEAPDIIGADRLSLLKNQAWSQASKEGGGAVRALRAQAQRSGVRSSPMALGAEAALRSRSFGRAAGINSDLEFRAAEANRNERGRTLNEYQRFFSDDQAAVRDYDQALVSLMANRQMGPSDLLAFL